MKRTRKRARILLVAFAALAVSHRATPARAEEDAADSVTWSYLVDGGALPFFWGSAAVAVGAFTLLSPPDTPRLFSSSEGGKTPKGDTISDLQMGLIAVSTPFLLAIPSTEARLYHAKGLAEALMTVAAVTEVTKNLVGRHRPMYAEGSTVADDRKSFFSGHASLTLASTTYLGMYFHQHVFSELRDEGQAFAAWEVVPLAALAAVAVYIPYTRLDDHRHHLSDVLVGGGVGTSAAVAFYLYQQRRFRRLRLGEQAPAVTLMPTSNGVAILGSW